MAKQRSFFKSLRGKISMQMLVLSLLPIIIVGVLAYTSMSNAEQSASDSLQDSRTQLEQDVVGSDILAKTAQGTADEIDMFMRARIENAIIWASAPIVVDTAKVGTALAEEQGLPDMTIDEIEELMADNRSLAPNPAADEYLKNQIEFSQHFGEIFFTEANGYNVALTASTSDFVQSDEGWWQIAWDNGISIGEVEYDDSAGIWSTDISVRIDDPDTGKPVGVMKTVLGVSLIQEIANANADDVSGGSVTVLDPNGLLLAETSTGNDLERIMNSDINLRDSGDAAVEKVYASDAANGYDVADDTITGYARSATAGYYEGITGFDGFGWAVLVEPPTEIAFASLGSLETLESDLKDDTQNMLVILIVVLAIVFVVALGVAFYVSQGITKPVAHLSDVAEKVSMGDLDVSVAVNSDDEIGDLADSFGRMVTAYRFMAQDEG